MARSPVCSRFFVYLMIAAFGTAGLVSAQEPEHPTVRGTIVAVQGSDGFDVNGYHVVITHGAQFLVLNGPRKDEGELWREIAVGAYVEVVGEKDRHTHFITARQVKIRENGERKVSGVSVIDGVTSRDPLLAFTADGYLFRLAADTEISFSGGVNAVTDVQSGTWVRYEGRSGEVIATIARFFMPKPRKSKRDPASAAQVTDIRPGSLIDFDGSLHRKDEKHRLQDAGGQCGWYPVPNAPSVQENIRRIGTSLVPAYQRDLPSDSPAKIPFRFYVVEEKYIRTDITCEEGLVLIPTTVINRLVNQNQLAAVVADGVAANLQRQQARVAVQLGLAQAAEWAAYIAMDSAGAFGTSPILGGAVVKHEIERRMENQRGRVALSLLSDAGYDPWQAPEAWRLLQPKTPPRDPAKSKYPERAEYQLEILGLRYRPAAASNELPKVDPGASPN